MVIVDYVLVGVSSWVGGGLVGCPVLPVHTGFVGVGGVVFLCCWWWRDSLLVSWGNVWKVGFRISGIVVQF